MPKIKNLNKKSIVCRFSYLCVYYFLSGTFKFQKTDMRREGFDPNVVSDKLYFLDCTKGQYVELNVELHRSIVSGKQKL